MKVCLLNESFPPVIDGVVNVMMNYADYMMRDHGAKVEVGTPEYPDGKYNDYPYPVIAYPSFDTASLTNGYRAGNPLVEKAVTKLAEFKPDIIHAHGPASATVVARLIREMTGSPIIFTYHTKYDIDIRRAAKINLIADEVIRAMVGNIEACDEVWTVSDGAGKALKSLGYQGDYRVMNNGVDFAKGRVDKEAVERATAGYDLPEGVPVFLYVGRLINYKNLPLILDALKILMDSGQDFRMVFVGKGPDKDILIRKAIERGLKKETNPLGAVVSGTGVKGASGSKVIFTGPIYNRDELRAWNTRADLFLFPSTFDTNGLVVREAAACGLASVLIRDSCAAEGITDDRNGFIIGESAQEMAELLMRLCKDMDHVHDVGQHAMDEIYLSWEDCVNTAYERYEYVLARNRIGAMPHHKKQFTDKMVEFTAKTMEEQKNMRRIRQEEKEKLRRIHEEGQEKLRRIHEEGQEKLRGKAEDLLRGFRGRAVATLEETKLAADTAKLIFEDINEDLWGDLEDLFKS